VIARLPLVTSLITNLKSLTVGVCMEVRIKGFDTRGFSHQFAACRRLFATQPFSEKERKTSGARVVPIRCFLCSKTDTKALELWGRPWWSHREASVLRGVVCENYNVCQCCLHSKPSALTFYRLRLHKSFTFRQKNWIQIWGGGMLIN